MEQLIVLRTLQEAESLYNYLLDKEFVAYDTETTGLDSECKIIGFSICADTDIGYYLILSEWDSKLQKMVDLETKEKAKSIVELLKTKKLIMHNAIFDCYMTYNNFGVSLIEHVHTDTLMLGHLLDENRSNGLKELGVSIFGADAKHEQKLMLESIKANGGQTTRESYELFKADSQLIAKYGAKDAILTLRLFYVLVEDLYAQQLDKFFYEDESMPLLRGPTYELNTVGLKVDKIKLQILKQELEAQATEAKAFIQKEIFPHVCEKYPATTKANTFNIGSNEQLAWLLFEKLDNEFNTLTDVGKEICRMLKLPAPYTKGAKRAFKLTMKANIDTPYAPEGLNIKTGKSIKAKLIKDFWKYTKCDKETLALYANKYVWVERLLQLKKISKILDTYVIGITERMKYGVIHPGFLQHGTTSGRYSSRNPNFQNLPRDDKRIKSCIIARPGQIFVGADYSQLEPRVFASLSQDPLLLQAFKSGDDFYSTIGIEVFDIQDATPKKDGEPNAFGIKYKKLRDIAKVIALSATYGTTASKMATSINKSKEEAQEVINNYFEKFPKVKEFMQTSHNIAKAQGYVVNLFGRPRRIPAATTIDQIYGKKSHEALPYEARTILNLSVNHIVQSTAAAVMNRAAIACWKTIKYVSNVDKRWENVKIILQVHDEMILEGPEELKEHMIKVLKYSMEQTVKLPGVDLIAEPKAAYNLADLK